MKRKHRGPCGHVMFLIVNTIDVGIGICKDIGISIDIEYMSWS